MGLSTLRVEPLKVGRTPMLVTGRRLRSCPSTGVARYVDTARGEQLLLRSEIQGRKEEAAARAGSWDDLSAEHERAAEQTSGMSDIAFSDFARRTLMIAGNNFALVS